MKHTITTTLLILSLGVSLPASQVLAESEAETTSKTSQQDTEQGLREALKAQVALAKAKVSLLQAQTDLWLEDNREAAQDSLDKAQDNLEEAWRSADQMTRARITKLKLQIDQASKLLTEKSDEANVALHRLADQSEAALNAALVQAQDKSSVLKNEAVTRYNLVQAKAAALTAQIALEIDKSPEKAQQALQDAENYLRQAKVNASEATTERIAQLQDKVQLSKQAVSEKAEASKSHINALIISTEEQIQTYKQALHDSDEAKLLKKRYGQLEAQAALLKANLTAKADATGEQAITYLDESKAWFISLKEQALTQGDEEFTEMLAHIDEVKQAVNRKDKQIRAKLAALMERMAQMLKDEKEPTVEDK